MDQKQIFDLISEIGEEIIDEDTLRSIVISKEGVIAYDGFEPSGRIHIAQGVMRTINTNKITKVGGRFKFWIADWFAMLNQKYDGDLDKIRNAGKLMIETFKACGMDTEKVEFLWSSEEINKDPNRYWSLVMDISTKFNLNRILKCTQIMGRKESDDLNASQIFYPVMQCADIFFLGVNVCSLGLDQRKVNMLAREYCDKVNHANKKSKNKRLLKPVILSHHMLLGLKGENKMSKSDPESAIYMDDQEMDVNRKIKRSFCPVEGLNKNPVLQYIKYIILEIFKVVSIVRKEENGGDKDYDNYAELEKDFLEGSLHPGDLKKAVSKYINKILEPVREYFKNNPEAQKLRRLVKGYTK